MRRFVFAPVLASAAVLLQTTFGQAATKITEPQLTEQNGAFSLSAIAYPYEAQCGVRKDAKGQWVYNGAGKVKERPNSVRPNPPPVTDEKINKLCGLVVDSRNLHDSIFDQASFAVNANVAAENFFGKADAAEYLAQPIEFGAARPLPDGSRTASAYYPSNNVAAEVVVSRDGHMHYQLTDTATGRYGALALDSDGTFSVTLSQDTEIGFSLNYTQSENASGAAPSAVLSAQTDGATRFVSQKVKERLPAEQMNRLRVFAEQLRARVAGPQLGKRAPEQAQRLNK